MKLIIINLYLTSAHVSVSQKLKVFKDDMVMVLRKYNLIKQSAINKTKFDSCLNNLNVYRSKFETSMMLGN